MATTLEIAKSLLSPPGDTIQEHIDFIGMSQVELAERMGRSKEKINDIIKGRASELRSLCDEPTVE
jgi:plasmid maintenance system antidote protein VapI